MFKIKSNLRKVATIVACLAVTMFSTCNKVDDAQVQKEGIDGKMFFGNTDSAPQAIVSKEKLPEWLNVKISEYEETHPAILPLFVYKGEWGNRVVYFMLYAIKSCMFCDVYYADGKNIVWTDNTNFDDFQSTSKNWLLVYKYIDETLKNT